MENNNYFKLELEAKNINESFARGVVAMFAGQLSPTVSEISPVFLPGESQGQGSLVGCRLWGRTESNMTEAT